MRFTTCQLISGIQNKHENTRKYVELETTKKLKPQTSSRIQQNETNHRQTQKYTTQQNLYTHNLEWEMIFFRNTERKTLKIEI